MIALRNVLVGCSVAAILLASAAGAWFAWYMTRGPGGSAIAYSQPSFTTDELNACAAEAELAEEIGRHKGDRQAAMDTMAVQNDYQDIAGLEAAYRGRFGLDTIYTGYLREGKTICLRHKAADEAILMPDIKIREGYYVARSPAGSAMMLKLGQNPYGEPDGTCQNSSGCFVRKNEGCIEGYHFSGKSNA